MFYSVFYSIIYFPVEVLSGGRQSSAVESSQLANFPAASQVQLRRGTEGRNQCIQSQLSMAFEGLHAATM